MTKHPGWIALSTGLLVAGCATSDHNRSQETKATATGSAQQVLSGIGRSMQGVFGTVGEIFDPRTRELREKVEMGEFEDAANLYVTNEHHYDPRRVADLVATIVRGLNDKMAPYARGVAANLPLDAATSDPTRWPQIKVALAGGKALIENYDAIALLRRPEHRSPERENLEQRITALEEALLEGAESQFVRYAHEVKPPFFENYPADLDADARTRILRATFPTWAEAVRKADEPASRALLRRYGPAVDDRAQRDLLAQAFADGIARRNGWNEPYTLFQALELFTAATKAVPGSKRLASWIALLVVENPAATAPWDGSQIGVPSFRSSVIELPRRLRTLLSRERFSHVIVADPYRISLVERTKQVRVLQSQRKIGKREEPNPDWERYRRRVEESELELSKVEADNVELQRQAGELARAYEGRGLGALGAVLGSGTGTWLVEDARRDVQEARRELASTPRTIWMDVMETYRYPTAARERTLLHQVGLYLVDANAKTVKRALITERAVRSASIVRHIDPNDPQRTALESSSAAALRELEALTPANPLIRPGELLDRLARYPEFDELQAAELSRALLQDRRQFESEQALERARARDESREAEQQLAQYGAPAARPMAEQRLKAALRSDVPPARSPAASAAADAEARAALCPRDMSHLSSRIRTSDVRAHLSQPIRDMIGKAGGVDRAIAMSHAQMREFERTRNQARQSALQSFGGPGAPLQAPCPFPEGIYCASANTYFMMQDSILYTNEVVKALSCYKSAGLR